MAARGEKKSQIVLPESEVRLLVGALAAMLWELNRQGNSRNPYYKQIKALEQTICEQTGYEFGEEAVQ